MRQLRSQSLTAVAAQEERGPRGARERHGPSSRRASHDDATLAEREANYEVDQAVHNQASAD